MVVPTLFTIYWLRLKKEWNWLVGSCTFSQRRLRTYVQWEDFCSIYPQRYTSTSEPTRLKHSRVTEKLKYNCQPFSSNLLPGSIFYQSRYGNQPHWWHHWSCRASWKLRFNKHNCFLQAHPLEGENAFLKHVYNKPSFSCPPTSCTENWTGCWSLELGEEGGADAGLILSVQGCARLNHFNPSNYFSVRK